jgi:hypothetical protein
MEGATENKDGKYAQTRVPGRIYISRRFPYKGSGTEDPLGGKAARFAYTVLDEETELEFSSDGGLEVVIRTTPTRQQLKALFLEYPRGIRTLSFQRFNSTNRRLRRESFTLRGEEVGQLIAFLSIVESEGLLLEDDERLRIPFELAQQIEIMGGKEALAHLARKEPALLEAIIRSDVSAPDVVALARRREVLAQFKTLLYDGEVFADAKREANGPEKAWQRFLEDNPWILGAGLAPEFLHSFDPSKLEKTVRGSSVRGSGKQADALLRTAGLLSALVLVEIKHHQTPLLNEKEYRPECWRVSDEVAGGVSQCLQVAEAADRELGPALDVRNEDGFLVEQVAVVRPRTILVVGSLEQFMQEDNIHRERYESFERFRRSLRAPEIITFDELHERAKLSLELAAKRDERPQ